MLLDLLECVINVSEGRDNRVLERLAGAAGGSLLDVHTDANHHRSVLTLAGSPDEVEQATRAVAAEAVRLIDLQRHSGVHPRMGSVDVVPFVTLEIGRRSEEGRTTGHGASRVHADTAADSARAYSQPFRSDPDAPPSPAETRLVDGNPAVALAARDRFAAWAADRLGLPCFCYGPERSLPDVRRRAWRDLQPDAGPPRPHATAGACAVGARPLLVAYNLWLAPGATLETARQTATAIRSPDVRALGLPVATGFQVSCNLIHPLSTGPADVYDAVVARVDVDHAELVGLLPAAVLDVTAPERWEQLGLGPSTTIEARLGKAGLDGGRFAGD